MLVTIIDHWSSKELLYWVQEVVWNPIVYDVSEEKIDLIRTCTVDRIQEVINFICLTSPRWNIVNL